MFTADVCEWCNSGQAQNTAILEIYSNILKKNATISKNNIRDGFVKTSLLFSPNDVVY